MTKLVIEAVKSKGISAVGAAGFCWGGEFSLLVLLCLIFCLFSVFSFCFFVALDTPFPTKESSRLLFMPKINISYMLNHLRFNA